MRYFKKRESSQENKTKNEINKMISENVSKMITEEIARQLKMNNVILCNESVMNYYLNNEKKQTSMIINSGCLSSLAGEEIVNNYLKNNNLDTNKIESSEVKEYLKFGTNHYLSKNKVKIPIQMQTETGMLEENIKLFVVKLD